MMYPFMTLSDETEIAHSEQKADGTVKVFIEQPIDGGFRCATCILPMHEWKDINGFTDSEILRLKKLIRNNAHLIIEFAQQGGFSNASGF